MLEDLVVGNAQNLDIIPFKKGGTFHIPCEVFIFVMLRTIQFNH